MEVLPTIKNRMKDVENVERRTLKKYQPETSHVALIYATRFLFCIQGKAATTKTAKTFSSRTHQNNKEKTKSEKEKLRGMINGHILFIRSVSAFVHQHISCDNNVEKNIKATYSGRIMSKEILIPCFFSTSFFIFFSKEKKI